MPTTKELQGRIKQASDLLGRKDLPAEDRLKVAKLRLLDQLGVAIRQKRPDFDDRATPKEAQAPIKEPPAT